MARSPTERMESLPPELLFPASDVILGETLATSSHSIIQQATVYGTPVCVKVRMGPPMGPTIDHGCLSGFTTTRSGRCRPLCVA